MSSLTSFLGINNGWIDPVLQYQAYPIFAYNNTYKQLISASQYQSYMVCRSNPTLCLLSSARLLTMPRGLLLQLHAGPADIIVLKISLN